MYDVAVVGQGPAGGMAALRLAEAGHSVVTFDRKIMVGSRAQIDFDEKSFLGLTALYYDQDIVNKKVDFTWNFSDQKFLFIGLLILSLISTLPIFLKKFNLLKL